MPIVHFLIVRDECVLTPAEGRKGQSWMRDFPFSFGSIRAGLQHAISPTHFARTEQNRTDKGQLMLVIWVFLSTTWEENRLEPISKRTSLLWFLWWAVALQSDHKHIDCFWFWFFFNFLAHHSPHEYIYISISDRFFSGSHQIIIIIKKIKYIRQNIMIPVKADVTYLRQTRQELEKRSGLLGPLVICWTCAL